MGASFYDCIKNYYQCDMIEQAALRVHVNQQVEIALLGSLTTSN